MSKKNAYLVEEHERDVAVQRRLERKVDAKVQPAAARQRPGREAPGGVQVVEQRAVVHVRHHLCRLLQVHLRRVPVCRASTLAFCNRNLPYMRQRPERRVVVGDQTKCCPAKETTADRCVRCKSDLCMRTFCQTCAPVLNTNSAHA